MKAALSTGSRLKQLRFDAGCDTQVPRADRHLLPQTSASTVKQDLIPK
jgi:hypothetical protein